MPKRSTFGDYILVDLQARHDWFLPALRQAAFTSLPRGVRLPLQQSRETWGISDVSRTVAAMKGAEGKRLTDKQPDAQNI